MKAIKLLSLLEPLFSLFKRFNTKTRNVEIKTSKDTEDMSNLQKAADFVKAFILGFEVDDALALLRLDDLYLDSFEVLDVKTLKGDHMVNELFVLVVRFFFISSCVSLGSLYWPFGWERRSHEIHD